MRLRVEAFPRFGEPVTLRTFCSGLGRFSAERRTTVRGEIGRGRRGRPLGLDRRRAASRRGSPQRFLELYGAERRRPRGAGPPAPSRAAAGARRAPWRFRAADVDVAGHVNNSHYWEPLEEELAGAEPGGIDAEIEHREPALAGRGRRASATATGSGSRRAAASAPRSALTA